MADVIKSIRTYLLTKTAITDLVGQRIYASRLPQSQSQTANCIVLRITSETYDHALDGLAGIVATRLAVECYATSGEVSRSIADAVIWCGIDAIKGTYTNLSIRSVMVEDGRREYEEEDTSGGDSQRHVVTFDFMVTWLRS
jgi:hypothetical protein